MTWNRTSRFLELIEKLEYRVFKDTYFQIAFVAALLSIIVAVVCVMTTGRILSGWIWLAFDIGGLVTVGAGRYSIVRPTESICSSCKYPLRGLTGDRCPECGTKRADMRPVLRYTTDTGKKLLTAGLACILFPLVYSILLNVL